MRVDGRGTVVLTGSATDTQDAESALDFSWSAPSGTFRDSSNASTVWTAPLPTTLEQSVSLTLTVTDTGGLSGTARVTIFVNAGAAPQPTAVGAAWNRPPGLRTDWSTDVWSTVPGTWDTFSGAGRAFSIDRGRGSEIDDPIVGTLNLSLDNVSGDYWSVEARTAPGAGRQVRIVATYAGVDYDVFTGVFEAFDPTFDKSRRATVDAVASDGRRQIEQAEPITDMTGYPQQRTDERVAAVLDTIGWASSRRELDRGQELVTATGALDKESAAELLRQTQAVEFGRSYIGANGAYVFRNRSATLPSPVIVLGPSDSPMFAPRFEHNDRLVANRVSVTRTGGTVQLAEDVTSQGRYGVRASEVDGLPLTSDPASLSLAAALVVRYAEPLLEVRSLEIRPGVDPDVLYPLVLGLDLGASISINLPEAGIVQEYTVEGIQHEVFVNEAGAPTWGTALRLGRISTAAPGVTYWQLGVAGASELGDTTRLYLI